MSIGEVLSQLRADFPDVTISKLRFLETEGLVEPSRTAAGYRKYTFRDVARLRYVLTAQRDHYLPLRVIREHLASLEDGAVPVLASASSSPSPQSEGEVRLSRADLLEASGLTDAELVELERTGIVTPRRGGTYYGRDALTLAIAARRLGEYGIDGRHLRAFKMSADREVGLVEQAIAPHVRRAGGNKDVSGEVTQLVISFHAALVRTAMER